MILDKANGEINTCIVLKEDLNGWLGLLFNIVWADSTCMIPK
jgi:hypothetical protein